MSKSQAAYMMKGRHLRLRDILNMEYDYQIMSNILIGQIEKAYSEFMADYTLQRSWLKAGGLWSYYLSRPNNIGRAITYRAEIDEILLSMRQIGFTIYAYNFGSVAVVKMKNNC